MNENTLQEEIKKGEAFIMNNKAEEALAVFQSVLEKDPNNIIALNDKGVALNSLGRYGEAIKMFLDVLQKDQNNSNAVFNLISNYFAVAEWSKAENILKLYGDCLAQTDVNMIKNDLEKVRSNENNITDSEAEKEITRFDNGQTRQKAQGPSSDKTPGIININILGQQIAFQYPDSIFMKNIVLGILQGKDYPIIKLPYSYPKIIFDIGANVGATALYFNSYFPDSQIYCYEPSPDNIKYLRENTKHFSNIKTFAYGLFDKSCELPLYSGKDQCAQNSIVKNRETNSDFEIVKLVKLSEEILQKGINHISILKIDTEGCECQILHEIFHKTENLDIDIMYIEYHSEDDRIEIDRTVSQRFLLRYSRANQLHRGTKVYISKALILLNPGLEWQKISGNKVNEVYERKQEN